MIRTRFSLPFHVVLFAALLPACGTDRRTEGDDVVTTQRSALTFGTCSKNRVATSVGFNHSCALLSDGTVECWGSNTTGEVGNGGFDSPVVTPTAVVGIQGATQIAAGWYHNCARISDGTVQCWGANGDGALGSATPDFTAIPQAVPGITTATAIAAGFNATCAVLADGTAQCWGDNSSGALGDGSGLSHAKPGPVFGLTSIREIAMGADHACARTSAGEVYCWGVNTQGQLGTGNNAFSSVPVLVSGLSNISGITAGAEHTCARGPNVLGAANLYCWGGNGRGQLGNGTTNNSNTPIQVPNVTQVRGVFASSNSYTTCALPSNGAMLCWGDNQFGQLGNGTLSSQPSPTPTFVTGLTLADSASVSIQHGCAIRQSGQLVCWGANFDGEVGFGPLNTINSVWVSPAGGGVSPAGQLCRASAGPCDLAESCDGATANCPADAFVSASTVCRASAGICDVAETCTGAAAACPPDGLVAAGTTCRAAAGICDVAETCSGRDPTCPPDQLARGGVCRPSNGACDVAEFCDGSTPDCPVDGFQAAGFNCRFALGPCDVTEVCSGGSPDCPPDLLSPVGTICHLPVNVCDMTETCTGTSVSCPPSSFIPGCGGDIAGLVSFRGAPVGGQESASLRVLGFGNPGWTAFLDPATARYDSGTVLPGSFGVAVYGIGCGELDGRLAFTNATVSGTGTTTADFDITQSASLLAGTIQVGGVPASATITIYRDSTEACTVLTTDASGHYAAFFVPGSYTATVTDSTTGADLGTLAFDAGPGETISAPLLAGIGATCADGSQCATGFCVDGVCCDGACGGGNSHDCQACSIAAGAAVDGACTALPAGRVCRAAAGTCDVAEMCDGGSLDCPADDLVPAGNECAPASGFCQTAGQCQAGNPICPGATSLPATLCASGATGQKIPLLGGTTTVGGLTLEFLSTTTWSGQVRATTSDTGCPPPTGFEILGSSQSSTSGHYWDLEPSTQPPAPIRICFHYDDSWITGDEHLLRIAHGALAPDGSCDLSAAGWTMLPTQSIDTTNNIICANTPSLSPFALVEPIPAAGPPTFAGVPRPIVAYASKTTGVAVSYTPPTASSGATSVPVTCAPASGSTFAPGQKAVTCTATASGGTATVSFSVWVQYQAPSDGTFFQQPINPDGSSIFKLGSTIPVKFKLTGASAAITNLVAHLRTAKASSTVTGTSVEATQSCTANSGDTFRYDATGKQYVFNLSTKGMASGTWSLRADLGDAVDHTIKVSLK